MPDNIERSVYRGGVGEVVEKKSRFIATVAAVSTKEEAEEFVASMKKKYWDARHNCSAYIIADTVDILHSSDDGEPSGTAGKPMLEILLNEGIKNVCVVVTRYFGGTLLGTGGLVRAYQAAVKEGIANSILIEKKKGISADITVDYNDIGKLQYFFANNGVEILDNIYEEQVVMKLLIPSESKKALEEKLVDITNGKTVLDHPEEVYYAHIEGEVKIWKKEWKADSKS
ncbi:MAG: YigZ family protein [Lachnospiraceae bacterium]|nr:YigZ family protein [Lachnospiraceae bacterium]